MSVIVAEIGTLNELFMIDGGVSDFEWRDFLMGVGICSDFDGDVGGAVLDGFFFLLFPYFAS